MTNDYRKPQNHSAAVGRVSFSIHFLLLIHFLAMIQEGSKKVASVMIDTVIRNYQRASYLESAQKACKLQACIQDAA